MSAKVSRTEVRAAFRDVRRYVAEAQLFLDEGDLGRAYSAAEAAERSAFDAKDLIANGGKYDASANHWRREGAEG